jgi:3,4-dihydroxy-2-butanone 4-phosphate synthase
VTVRLDSIERAIADIKAGRPVVVIDDEDRENEGDLIFAAELVTPELIAFMVRYTSGYICVPITETDADRLDLPPMFRVNQDRRGTAYTVTVDAREGVSTGISAADRARTIGLLADPAATAADFSRPGHVVPLRAKRRRRAAPPRPHRGGGRPRRARRAASGGRAVRDRQREGSRRHGARRGTAACSPTCTSWR